MLKAIVGTLVVATLLIGAYPQDAKQTLAQIYEKEMQGYQSWSLVPDSEAKMPGKGAHGKFITTYVNDIGLKAMNTGADALPDGTILIKDNFHKTDDSAPWSAVMMKKIDGKWFFGVFFPPYEAKMAGFPEPGTPAEKACLSCHVKAPNDRVFLWQK